VSLVRDPRLRLALAVAAAVLAVDQATKAIVERTMALHETIPLLPVFALTYVRNTGAAFGLLAGAPAAVRLPLFLLVTAAAAWALFSMLRHATPRQRGLVAAVGAILGGAAGNLVCRVRYGEVIDFLDAHWGDLHWPAFNVADTAITLGVIAVLVLGVRDDERR
jgi:signal peptidase II